MRGQETFSKADAESREVEERTLFDWLYKGYLSHNELTFVKGEKRKPHYDPGLPYRLKNAKEKSVTAEEATEQVMGNITAFLKEVGQKYKRPMLLRSSGSDTFVIKTLFEKSVGPIATVTHSFYGTPYDEFEVLKKRGGLTPINYSVRSYDDVLSYLSHYIELAKQPISGLQTVGIMKAHKFAADWGADVVLGGVEDAIWFTGNRELLDSKVRAVDNTRLVPTDFLTDDFKARVKTEDPVLDLKSRLKKHTFEQFMFYKSPKIIHDFRAAGKANGLQHAFPYLDDKNIELVMSLPDDVLHFNDQPKSIIANIVKKLGGESYQMGMITPQRELVRTTYRESIIKMIENSQLVKDGYVDREKLLPMFKDYCRQKELGNSFFIWKFITAEIYYSLFFHGIRKDLYMTA
jgi:hypothetical protein